MTSKSLQCIILFLFITLPLLLTLPQYGVTFDEPIYLEAARNVQKWMSLPGGQFFDPDTIARYWKTDPLRNVHPSGLKWLYLTAGKIIFWENDPYLQNRILTVLLFSICMTVFLYWWMGDSPGSRILYVLLLLTIPRFFAHLHFAATDIPMTALLLLLVVCLDRTLFQGKYWLSGILLGLLACIKITAVLLTIPLIFTFLVWHRKRWRVIVPRIVVICLLGVLVFYLLNPDWWFSPFSRCKDFLNSTLTRRSWTPFTLYFGGHFYNYRGPWYYPFVIFLITTPLLHLACLFAGVALIVKEVHARWEIKTGLLVAGLATPFVILALPLSPANDGIRYLLPAFPFALCFMTRGILNGWRYLTGGPAPVKMGLAARCTVAAAGIALLGADLHSPGRYPPFELSYYNLLVGGISGAHRKGYETTYWWEILDPRALEEVNRRCKGATVYFPAPPTDLFFEQMRTQGRIAFTPSQERPQEADFMLIIGRPFVRFWEARTWPLYESAEKVPVPVWGIALDSVPLLRLYRIRKK